MNFCLLLGARFFILLLSVMLKEKTYIGSCSTIPRYPNLSHELPRNAGVWSGGAMVLGKLPVPGRPTILITVGQGAIARAVGAGGGGLDIFTRIYPISLSLRDGPI